MDTDVATAPTSTRQESAPADDTSHASNGSHGSNGAYGANGANGSERSGRSVEVAGESHESATQLRRLLRAVEAGNVRAIPPRDRRLLSWFSGYAAALEDVKLGRGAAIEREAARSSQRAARSAHSGRTPQIDPGVENTIVGMRNQGVSIRAIAAYLNARECPTVEGGTWQPSTIHSVLGRLKRSHEEATG